MKLARPLPMSVAQLAIAVALTFASNLPAMAQGAPRRVPLVRDAEIEALLKDYTAPIFKAAGLQAGAVDVYLVNDLRFNAFVSGRRMFVNTGAIKITETPNELIGVLAHETGHVVGGHQARLRDRVEKANILAALSMIAGAGVAVAGGEAGAAAGPAIAFGGQSALIHGMLAYQRSEEAAADNTAITLLTKTGQSGKGIVKTLARFQQELLFNSSRIDPYLQSHPMPRERLELIKTIAAKSPYYDAVDPPQLLLRHQMARAKITAYSGNSGELQAMFRDDPQGPPARYGLAIALFLAGSDRQALPMIDKLISEQPTNAYLYEMKGEMLLRGGQAKAATDAYQKAISLDRYKSGILRTELGLALLETRQPGAAEQAIGELKAGLARDPTNSRGYGYLARAYGAIGNEDLARSAAAEEAFHAGAYKEATRLAKLSQPKLKTGTPEWLRMQDIIDYKPPKPNSN